MNIVKLQLAEKRFFETYPGGFDNPELIEMGKRHKLKPRMEFCQISFALEKFTHPRRIVEDMVKAVSRSSMVSLFEKPKFRDFVKSLDEMHVIALSEGLKEILHGDQESGFEQMVDILAEAKLAKWTLITIIPTYFNPTFEVFVKPTTVKSILKNLELDDIQYKPTPTYEFYAKYRDYINEMKKHVDESLSPSNAAFSGFLMMSL